MTETQDHSCPKPDGRRTFCKVCIGGMTVASAGMVGFPVASFLGRPVRVGQDKPVEVPLDQLAEGQALFVDLRGQQVVVLTTPNGPLVLSASCPHLGCNVNWNTGDSTFHCPCHGAIFDSQGAVVSGPVSASLKKIPFQVQDGKLIIA